MSNTDISDTDEPEDAVELEVGTEQGAIDFIDHNVDAASNVEVAKIDVGPGFNCRATGFAGGSTFVPSTDKTAASKAQAKSDAAAKINGGADEVTLAKQPDGTWTVTT